MVFEEVENDMISVPYSDRPKVKHISIEPWKPLPGEEGLTMRRQSQRTTNSIDFSIHHITAPMANMIRRVIISEVPTMAFDRFVIEENSSAMPDEVLCHRMGLIPLRAPVKSFEYICPDDVEKNIDCSTGMGGASGGLFPTSPITVSSPLSIFQKLNFVDPNPYKMICFSLDISNPSRINPLTVHSGHMNWVPLGRGEGPQATMTSDEVYLIHDDIPIIKLGPDQRLRMKCYAVKGIGLVNAKFTPVSTCFYKFKHFIDVDEFTNNNSEKWDKKEKREKNQQLMKMCPGVFELDEDGVHLIVMDADKYTLGKHCLDDISEGKIKIIPSSTSVMFHIDSIGQYDATDLLPTAMRVFAERCRSLARQVRENNERQLHNVNGSLF